MQRDVTMKFRFTKDEAKKIRSLARRRGTTATDVVRTGVELLHERDERQEGVDLLISLIDGPEPPKIRFRLR